jgi:ubiquinone/menaquinone biosynthesis C-methylase UbiE
MDPNDAVELLTAAVPRVPGVWADFGAGDGTFTAALAGLLGSGSTIYAVDRDSRALKRLERRMMQEGVRVVPVVADFTERFDLPELAAGGLDGMLFANALHFTPHPEIVLTTLAQRLKADGRVVIVEYDRRGPNRWVPHPIPLERLPAVIAAAKLQEPVVTAKRASAFGGELYVAVSGRE